MEDIPKNLSVNEIALEVAQLLVDLQLSDLVVLDVKQQCTWADVLVVATYTSETQAKSAMHEVKQLLYRYDFPIQTHSKSPQSRWLVVDAYNIVVNFLNPQERTFYALEDLWKEGDLLFSTKKEHS
ncbi:ribosome silencing factor [Entomospira culicis]|uniref:Ribosome silencing factor n=1 Tax=Entomospira culicis TaxID=2719989 RepID=A0A968GGR5_9SPIO|nr:ribosome silencing factor [Entomospira culicis]NIZ19317.1 ribosome silencing factor [Entomospira culicis]NIZ69778.1 ribosome silencing factor [Entomospira culicis]WDI36889.1 ribosome silencing factor [Entomospira culicis]WDI38518.1 ribosome silencing factor [Entomospira culicis]